MSCFPSDTLVRHRFQAFVWDHFGVQSPFLVSLVWERLEARRRDTLTKLAAYDQKLKI